MCRILKFIILPKCLKLSLIEVNFGNNKKSDLQVNYLIFAFVLNVLLRALINHFLSDLYVQDNCIQSFYQIQAYLEVFHIFKPNAQKQVCIVTSCFIIIIVRRNCSCKNMRTIYIENTCFLLYLHLYLLHCSMQCKCQQLSQQDVGLLIQSYRVRDPSLARRFCSKLSKFSHLFNQFSQ